MLFWRRMLKVSWTYTIANEDILEQVNDKRTIVELRKKHWRLFRDNLRDKNMQNKVTIGKIKIR
jgi:hypothetical protein